jgi:hypothetical protein
MAKIAQNIKNLYDVYNGDSRRFLPIIAGNTPFGYYDNDTEFVRDARRVCGFVAIHLGVGGLKLTPIKAVSDMTVLASFEEAVTTYGNMVYQYKIRDNYINMEGGDTLPFMNNTNTFVDSTKIGSPVRWSTSRNATWKEIEYDQAYSQSVVDGEIYVISSSLSDYIAPDFDYIKSFGFSSPYSSSLYGSTLDLNQYINNQFNRVGGPTVVTPYYNANSGSYDFSSYTAADSVFSITGSNTVKIEFKVTASAETDTAAVFYIPTGSTSAITAQNIADKITNVSLGTFGTAVAVTTGSTPEILSFTSSLSLNYNIANYKVNNTTIFSNVTSGSNFEITEGNTFVYYFPTTPLIQSGSNVFNGAGTIPTTYIQSNLNPALNDKIISNNFTTITSVISDGYGAEAEVGGNYDVKKGTLKVTAGVQDYDLNAWAAASASLSGSGDRIEVRRIFHEQSPAIARYFDPYAGTGTGIQSLLETFGFGQFSPGINFLLMPISFDVMKLQAIELNDQIRKSAYSFDLVNNQLKIFPVPNRDMNYYFEYVTISQKNEIVRDTRANIVTDIMNVPYRNPIYMNINTVGRLWIFKYTAALCKEIEGETNAKLDYGVQGQPYAKGGEMLSTARTEKENLINELKEMLNETSRRNQLERKQLESQYLRDTLQQVPLPIYIL